MKKVLLATSALVVTAGYASAQGVALSGSAEMGIIGGDNIETQFHTDIDVKFSMSGETDNGLTFGASIDLDESDGSSGTSTVTCTLVTNKKGTITGVTCPDSTAGASPAFGNTTQGGETVFLSGAFGTLTMGDTDGAFDWALSEAIIGGAINDDHEHAGYNGNAGLDGRWDGQIARYNYSFGDFAFAASVEIDDSGVGNAGLDGRWDGQIARYNYSFGDFAFAASVEIDDSGVGNPVWGVGGKYTASLAGVDVSFGVGYQTHIAHQIVGVSASVDLDSGIQAIVNYSDLGGVNNLQNHAGIAVGYTMDAWTFAVNYGVYQHVATRLANNEGVGVVVNYDMGGGAEVQFGYGSSKVSAPVLGNPAATTTNDTFSLGVAMSF